MNKQILIDILFTLFKFFNKLNINNNTIYYITTILNILYIRGMTIK